jgi:hypothetical protein
MAEQGGSGDVVQIRQGAQGASDGLGAVSGLGASGAAPVRASGSSWERLRRLGSAESAQAACGVHAASSPTAGILVSHGGT